MLENANTKIVRRWFEEVWNQRRLETIDELLAPDCLAHDLSGPNTCARGPAEFRQMAEALHGAFSEMKFVVEDIFGVEDRVAVRVSASMRNTGPLGDLPPTGNPVKFEVMCIIHLRDGKLIEGWNYWDVGAALKAANAPLDRRTIL